MNVSPSFGDNLRSMLQEVDVARATDEDLDKHENGELQLAALELGYTHMVSYDKRMASDHPPHMPVLLLDDPKQGFADSPPSSPDELETRLVASAKATAEILQGPTLAVRYHGVAVPGYKPHRNLRRVLEGKHRTHPDYKTCGFSR